MPSIPTSTKLLNALLRPTLAGQRTPDRIFDLLVAKAERDANWSALGDEAFVEDYRRLFHAFAKMDRLTAIGWQAVQADIQLRLQNRLRIRRLHHDHPDIGREEVVAPIFVAALPRTAATLTRGVLARSANHRAPLLWEMAFTDIELPERERRERIKSVAALYKQLSRLAPKFHDTYGFDAEKPWDCSQLLPHGAQHLTRAILPDYVEWLYKRDFSIDYRHLKAALQVLQYGRPTTRWVVEASANLANFAVIREIFPDAKIVWLHRDPVTIVGSTCSLIETSMALHVRGPDLHAIGAVWLKLMATMIERARADRMKLPRDAVINVPYPQLDADARAKLPVLYEQIGTPWTQADSGRLEEVLAGPGIGRAHEHDLSRYGLTSTDAEAAFGDYPLTIPYMRLG
ncbi:sulfotransferase family protein [Glycomyces rhizosphaerae]|uniref:Sulfotransferase family protein n=1 Tax=Glycomyces rhizosphaerae TaxID=2054422 RepID=A0ABV7PUQ1_9ACTN